MAWRDIKGELIVIILLVFVLPPAAWFYRDYALGKRLQVELDALRAQRMPVSLAEAAPKPVPDNQNAAVLYQQVFRVDFQTHSNACRLPDFSMDEYELVWAFMDEPNAEGAEFLRGFFSDPQTQQCLQTLREASIRPHSVFDVNWQDRSMVLFQRYSRFRAATRLIAPRASLAAHDGNIAEALEWHAVVFRMSEHLMEEPLPIPQLVAFAMQGMSFRPLGVTLSNNEIPPEAARDLEECLRELDPRSAFLDAMVGERAHGCDSFATCFPHDAWTELSYWEGLLKEDALEGVSAPQEALYMGPLGRPLRRTDQLIYLDIMEKAVLAAALPYRLAKPRVEALEDETDSLPAARAPFTKMMAFTHLGFWEKRDRAIANIALCRIVLALKCYRYEHDAYPAALQELQNTLDWPLPEDPFSGADFIYLAQEDGFIIYSLGPDLGDDGGLPERDEFGKRRDRFDIVWECTR